MAENKTKNNNRHIILFNCQDEISNFEEIVHKELKPITNFSKILQDRFGGFLKKNGRHLSVITPSYKIYCGTDCESIPGKEIDIYGEAGLDEFISLARENAWKIYDKGVNDFLDLD